MLPVHLKSACLGRRTQISIIILTYSTEISSPQSATAPSSATTRQISEARKPGYLIHLILPCSYLPSQDLMRQLDAHSSRCRGALVTSWCPNVLGILEAATSRETSFSCLHLSPLTFASCFCPSTNSEGGPIWPAMTEGVFRNAIIPWPVGQQVHLHHVLSDRTLI